MFSRIGPPAFKHDLTNTLAICAWLNNPERKFKSIHIAGTNGKGSVSHMLAAILQTAGYKTGLYTSPHLKDFRERIKINGEMITEASVINFTEKITPLVEEIEPSFFEITVGMAFDYFENEKVDIAIIETGLGGRFDSTNVITPELSIITNIGWDHMNMLGNTLEKIAFEKAGIIKPGVPVVVGETTTALKKIFAAVSTEKKSPLFFVSDKWQVTDWRWENHYLIIEVMEKHNIDHKIYKLDLPGLYQTKNILPVLESCFLLQQAGWKISEKEILQGLQQAKKITGLHGRWEILQTSPLVVLDVAHNTDGIHQLVQQIELTNHNQLHIVIGMVKDKEVEKVLSLLPKHASYYFTKASISRALPEGELAQTAAKAGLKGTSWPDVNMALKAAREKAHPDDMIIICGSVFLVGEVN